MEKSLLRAARQGDTDAFERLVTPCEQALWRLCWHHMRNQEDAQDCLQETMIKAWRSLGNYREESSLETWLCRIAVNTCLDALRKRKVRQSESLDTLTEESGFEPKDPAPGPEEEAIRRDEKQRLRSALDQLPEDMRSPLILYALEQRPYEEIAAITGAAVGTVKSRIARARQKLKEILNAGEQNAPSRVRREERRAES